MIETMTPDIRQAIHLFFADKIFDASGPAQYRIGIEDIKKEFRKKAMLFHPDRAEFLGQSKVFLEEKFKEISHAYGILKSEFDDKYLILRPKVAGRSTDFDQKRTSTIFTARPKPQSAAGRKPFTPGDWATHESARRNTRERKNPGKHFFFKGMVPERRLRLGEYLFYRRVIAWQTLINAIVWQHRVRPRLGQLAVEMNYLEQQHILEILKSKTFKEPFGRAAVRLGFLDDYKRYVLLGRQRGYNQPLGKYFLDLNLFSETELERYIQENRIHNIHYQKRFHGL